VSVIFFKTNYGTKNQSEKLEPYFGSQVILPVCGMCVMHLRNRELHGDNCLRETAVHGDFFVIGALEAYLLLLTSVSLSLERVTRT